MSGWGNQGGNQAGWGAQGTGQGGWGTQPNKGTAQGQGGWGAQGTQGTNQAGWGAQGTNQAGWGAQGTGQGGWGAQGTVHTQGTTQWGAQGTQGQQQWGTQGQQGQQAQWGAQGQQGQWGGQGQTQGQQWGGNQGGQGGQGGIKGFFSGIFNPSKKANNINGKFTKREYYSIVSEKAGRVLDVAQSGNAKGTLIIWDGYNGDNQAFGIVQEGSGYFIKCRQNKQYLTVENASDGARFFLSPNKTAQSVFRIAETSSGSKKFVFYTFCDKVLDLYQGIKENGTQVVQWTYNGNSNQVWYLNDPKDITTSSSGREF